MYYLIQCGTETIGTATNLDFCSYSEERGIMMLCPATMAQVISCAGGYYHDTWMASDPSQIGILATVTPIHKDVYDLYNEQGELPEPDPEPDPEPETPEVTTDLEVARNTIKARLLTERNRMLQTAIEMSFGSVPQTQEGITALMLAAVMLRNSTANPMILTESGYVEITADQLIDTLNAVNSFRQQTEERYQDLLEQVDTGSLADIIDIHLT